MTEQKVQYVAGDNMAEVMEALRQPFEPGQHQWKPQVVRDDRAMVVCFVDPRLYEDRLDSVAGLNWGKRLIPGAASGDLICELTIFGITRAAAGEADPDDRNTLTSAEAQAFKRACSAFGLGRYMYHLPRIWVSYDRAKNRVLDGEIAKLTEALRTGDWSPFGSAAIRKAGYASGDAPPQQGKGTDQKGRYKPADVTVPERSDQATKAAMALALTFGKHKGQTLGQLYEDEFSYIVWLAANASKPDVRQAALYIMAYSPKGKGATGTGEAGEAQAKTTEQMDAPTQFWLIVNQKGVSREDAMALLDEHGNDFAKAAEALEAEGKS